MQQPFILERVFDAPVRDVWKALTEKELMKQWYFDLEEFKPEIGFEFRFTGGPAPDKQYLHVCKILEVVPGKKLRHSWKYEGYEGVSYLTFELFEQDNKTKLVLTHEGLETFPASNPDFDTKNFEAGWDGLINTSLANFLSKSKTMNKNLLFDFSVDKEKKTVYITREFNAELSLVWDAFTKAELLDQWTAPAPFVARTKYMNFEVGGKRFYAMVGPDGQERWAIQEYTSISPKTHFKMHNAFADKDENPQLPGSEWDYTFSEQDGKTTVNITIYNESLARMEMMIEMGFKEGFTATLANLENLLTSLS